MHDFRDILASREKLFLEKLIAAQLIRNYLPYIEPKD
jgi:hypothetical protein